MSIENDLSLIQDYDKNYCLQVFNLLPVAFTKGKGCYLYDTEGRKYLDMIGGIAVNCLGYAHPKLTSAICSQAKNIIHACNYYYIPQKSELAYRLCRASFADKVFFCNSGAEANEAAIKLARSYFYYKDINKYEIITATMSFHGRTMGTVAATGQEKFQTPFAPNLPGFVYVPYNDIDAMIQAVTPKTAAIMLELVQGESGVHPADLEYIQAIKKLCVEKGVLLIFDEVQTGIGRTGKMFCYQNYGVQPDIMTLAKGLGGGVPIGAMLTTNAIATGMKPGDHGSTFGGNPLACAAGNAVLETIEEENIIDNVRDVSADLFEKLNNLRAKYNCIRSVRGMGLLIGIEFDDTITAKGMREQLFSMGFLVSAIGNSTIRLAPPLIITKQQAASFVKALDKILKEIPQKIASLEQRIAGYKSDIAHAEANTHPNDDGFSPMIIRGETFTDKKAAGTELLAVCKTMTNPEPVKIGSYRGLEMELFFDTFSREYKITLKNELRHTTPLGTDIFGNIQRLDNLIASFPEKQTACENQLDNEKVQLENAKSELDKPFIHEEELKTESARLAELNAMLDLNKRDNEIVDNDREEEIEEPVRKREEREDR